MATKAAPKATSADEAKPKKSKTLIIVLALAILLAGGGAGAWYFMTQKAVAPAHAAEKTADAKPPVFLPMEAFTVNLQAENGEQFLQTSVTLQVSDQAQVELIKLYLPHVRSRMLLLLSSKKASEILSVEGKNKLSDEILNIFKQPFTPQGPTIKVSNVLFTSFVVQ